MGSQYRPVGLGGYQGISGPIRMDEIGTLNGDGTALSIGGAVTFVAGSIARAALAGETVFINAESTFVGADGAVLALSETAGDFFRNIGTNQWLIDGEATINETEVSVGWFNIVLPENYVAGGAISLVASALVILAGDAANDATSTIDMEARLVTKATGAVGSDLVTTAAQTLATAGADYAFVVTPTGLVAGDKLVCKFTTSVVETAGGTGAANSRITKIGANVAVKG